MPERYRYEQPFGRTDYEERYGHGGDHGKGHADGHGNDHGVNLPADAHKAVTPAHPSNEH